jgi:NADPH2:quinone reductase
MQCALIEGFGNPAEVVAPAERPLPEPGAGEARVRMTLSPIHNHDLAIVRGVYGYRPSLPAVPGTEAVGVVDGLGDGVQGLRIGQRVATASTNGVWAEHFIATAAKLVPVPDALPDEAACQLLAMPLSALMLLEACAWRRASGWCRTRPTAPWARCWQRWLASAACMP